MDFAVEVLGYLIRARLEFLDDGLNVTIFGGCSSHIGCVSVAEADGSLQSIAIPGHKEQVVSERWARALAKKHKCRTAVTCGIHYDDLTKEELAQVIAAIGRLLERVLG